MHVTWHGQYSIKLQANDTTILLDPYSAETGLPRLRVKADIVALTNPSDPTMSAIDDIQGDPVIINTPGEFSIKEFTLHSLSWHDEQGTERNIQRWHIDGMVILHVGALNRELTNLELGELERTGIDVLLLPIGGGTGLTTKDALKLLTLVEPRVVIPIHYALPKLTESLDSLEQFAKEMGIEPQHAESKVILKANKLPADELQAILLKP